MKKQDVFIKRNDSRFSDSLLKEAQGLSCLRQVLQDALNDYLCIPEVHEVNESEMILERIHSCSPTSLHYQHLAKGLADLHRAEHRQFGFSEDNYIGLNPQRNGLDNDWGHFFVAYRLQFQIKLIKDSAIRARFGEILESVGETLSAYLNQYCAYPSLVHGDLWSGNVLFSGKSGEEKVWLIDPAVYYGDREVDIAMTEMFGGFSEGFYKAYQNAFPLTEEYPTKRVIYNLYHYLNHYNLFGGAYLSSCQSGFDLLEHKFRKP